MQKLCKVHAKKVFICHHVKKYTILRLGLPPIFSSYCPNRILTHFHSFSTLQDFILIIRVWI